MSNDAKSYPALNHLIGAYFHQDYDIEGPELEDVMNAFRQAATPTERSSLVADIERFLSINDPTLDQVFDETFQPDIIASAFRPTAREFLSAIRQQIAPG